MKRILQFFVLCSIFCFSAVSVSAAIAVSGTVYESANPSQGASVTVQCYNNNELKGELSTTTDSNGIYAVEFAGTGDNKCRTNYDEIIVSAQNGNAKGSNAVSSLDNKLTIDVHMQHAAVPEFTTIGAALALAGSAGAIAWSRRKQR